MGGRGVFRRGGGLNKAPLWIFLNTGGANSGIHIVKIYFLYCIFPPFLFYFLAGDKTRSYNRSFLFKMFYSPKRLNFVTFYWTTGGGQKELHPGFWKIPLRLWKIPPRVLENYKIFMSRGEILSWINKFQKKIILSKKFTLLCIMHGFRLYLHRGIWHFF